MEFQDMFPTDQACFEYLCLVRWPDGFECPHCQCREAWELKRFILRCKNCRRDVSVTAGTIFQDRHMPLRVIFQAMWYVVCQKQGVSALGLQGILGLGSYRIVWSWLQKLRTAMVRPWEGFTFWNSREVDRNTCWRYTRWKAWTRSRRKRACLSCS